MVPPASLFSPAPLENAMLIRQHGGFRDGSDLDVFAKPFREHGYLASASAIGACGGVDQQAGGYYAGEQVSCAELRIVWPCRLSSERPV
jgi:hypothetical protein